VVGERRDALEELGVALEDVGVEHGGGAQRQEPDQRADLQRDPRPVGHAHDVVVEAVLLVPEPGVVARRVQRDRDPAEVRDELERQVGEEPVVLG
jgi:hypothetical protein